MFSLGEACPIIAMHYVDEEGDQIKLTSDEELACALSSHSGHHLRIFFSSAPTNEPTEASLLNGLQRLQLTGAGAGAGEQETTPMATTQTNLKVRCHGFYGCPQLCKKRRAFGHNSSSSSEESSSSSDESNMIDANLDLQLSHLKEKGFGGSPWKRRRNIRVLKKFGGNVSQAEAFLAERRKRRLPWQEEMAGPTRQGHHPVWRKHEGCKRKIEKHHSKECTKRNHCGGMKRNHCGGKHSSICKAIALAPLLMQLEEKGFGGNEWKKRRNARLLHHFHGDLALVLALLEAKKNRPTKEIPPQYENLPSQLEQKGYGGQEWSKRGNMRLLKKFNSDVDKVGQILKAREQTNHGSNEYRKPHGHRNGCWKSCNKAAI